MNGARPNDGEQPGDPARAASSRRFQTRPSPLTSQSPPVGPPQVPDHELLRCIGRGSYGEVWLARNIVGTLRAVKVVYRDRFEHERPYEREFEGIRKFEPISRLHDSQVDILHIGRNEEAGCFYYVMELADQAEAEPNGTLIRPADSLSHPMGEGRGEGASTQPSTPNPLSYTPHTLKLDLHRRTRLPVDECLSIGLALTAAVQHLHEHGLVHRDIKPSNIIFVGGVPKLADIGLVASTDATMSFVGTSGFLPPEGPGTPPGDLYSLGKVLYEISTGLDRTAFPTLPPELIASGDGQALVELNAVILKACAHDPRHRYQSAQDMAADLALLQRGESVRRKRERERRWIVAKRGLALGTVVVAATGVWFAIGNSGNHFGQPQQGGLPNSWKPSPQASKLYDEGWKHLMAQTKAGIARSIDSFNRAVELEPNYALAFCGLADAYLSQAELVVPPIQALPEARKNARRAVEIDDKLADAHAYLGLVLMLSYDFRGAEKELKRAIGLQPTKEGPFTFYATLLQSLGRHVEARELRIKALGLTPSEEVRLRDWYHQVWGERKFDEAVQQAQKLVQVAPNWAVTPYLLGRAYAASGRLEDAAMALRGARELDDDPDSAGTLGYVYGKMGKINEAHAALLELKNWSRSRYVCPHAQAYVYAGLGEKEEAIRYLHLAYENRCHALPRLNCDPFWDDLRSDPHFQALLKNMGLGE